MPYIEVLTMLRLNVKKFMVAMFNLVVSLSFFFLIRRHLYRLLGMRVGAGTTIHRRVAVFDFGGLVIGSNSTINRGCYLDNRGGLEIGANVNMSHDVRVYTMGHNMRDARCPAASASVRIGDNAWLFPMVLVMPGVTIGEGAVVYPGSVVTKDVPPYAIAAGNPAKVIRQRDVGIAYVARYPVWFGV